ncbi:hypothetical protein UA45_12210 [Morganella morganii]|uniref:Uncharacterized protein n=1 Tax=Morganella morganii TaxID=582 RepID=A0A0D8L6I2_MORMO|nr:hypothetical protein UA45_12210 [Morganella morganii]
MFTLTLSFNAAGGRGRCGVRSIQEFTMQISRSLLFLLLLSGQSAAISQKIPAPEDLQGHWQFTEDGQTLPVELTTVPDSAADGFQLHFTAQPQIAAGVRAGRHCVSQRTTALPVISFPLKPPAVTVRKSGMTMAHVF